MAKKKIPKLNSKVQDYLDLHFGPAKKALNYVQDNDWSDIAKVIPREDEYDIQHLLTNKNIKSFIELYNTAEVAEQLDHPKVREAIVLFLEFFNLLESRFEVMEEKYDWATIFKGVKDEKTKKKAEIEFQTKVLSHLDNFKKNLRKINFGDMSSEINIAIFNDTPIPFMMQEEAEEKFPELREYMEKKAKGEIE